LQIGIKQKLRVKKFVDFGAYLTELDGESEQEVLLPRQYEPAGLDVGDEIEVFLYTDSEDRLIATTLMPHAFLGDIAILEVKDITDSGCFLDIGLLKDIFMPTKTPRHYKIGQFIAVIIALDKQERLIARLGIKERLKFAPQQTLKANVEIDIFIFEESDLGFGCVVDKQYFGLLFKKELFEKVKIGERRKAFIKRVREDGKIDLSIKEFGASGVKTEKQRVIDALKKNGGVLPLHYDSDPNIVHETCSLSKKGFKRALTELIKDRIIKLTVGEKIELADKF
jgi:predicted RNA-binding protein (virulence factor B family)